MPRGFRPSCVGIEEQVGALYVMGVGPLAWGHALAHHLSNPQLWANSSKLKMDQRVEELHGCGKHSYQREPSGGRAGRHQADGPFCYTPVGIPCPFPDKRLYQGDRLLPQHLANQLMDNHSLNYFFSQSSRRSHGGRAPCSSTTVTSTSKSTQHQKET